MKTRNVLAAAALAAAPLVMATPAQAAPTPLDTVGKVLPTDLAEPTPPAQEQDGDTFHNIDVVSFLPGVVDETWIVAFGGKETF